jgi:hypothetical protein
MMHLLRELVEVEGLALGRATTERRVWYGSRVSHAEAKQYCVFLDCRTTYVPLPGTVLVPVIGRGIA